MAKVSFLFSKILLFYDSSSEVICQQSDSMAKGYSSLMEKYGDVNGRVQPIKFLKNRRVKETFLYPVVSWLLIILLQLVYRYHDHHSENGIRIVQAFATLIGRCTDVFCFFSLLWDNQVKAIIWEDGAIIYIYIYIYVYMLKW